MNESDQHIPVARMTRPPAGISGTIPVRVPYPTSRPGVRWGMLAGWTLTTAIVLWTSPHRGALVILLVVLSVCVTVNNAISILAARVCGIRGVEEFAIGFAPTLAVFRFRGVVVRLGGFVAGGYVRFPANASGPNGPLAMRPIQGAVVVIAASLACFGIGWLVCLICGDGDILGRIATWIVAGRGHAPNLTDVFRSLLVDAVTPVGSLRALGLVLLCLGVGNLPSLALQGLAYVIRRPAEALLGPALPARIGTAVDQVLVLAVLACVFLIGVALLGVVLKG